jgi:hypothetical protein
MTTFLLALLLHTAAAVVLWLPLAWIGRRRRRMGTVRRYLVGAAATGLVCAVVAASSERLVNQCEAAGNPDCLDFGSTGIQIIFLGGYGLAVLLTAYLIHRD